jgi:hypothetical protein
VKYQANKIFSYNNNMTDNNKINKLINIIRQFEIGNNKEDDRTELIKYLTEYQEIISKRNELINKLKKMKNQFGGLELQEEKDRDLFLLEMKKKQAEIMTEVKGMVRPENNHGSNSNLGYHPEPMTSSQFRP